MMRRVAKQTLLRTVESKRHAIVNENWGSTFLSLANAFGTSWQYVNVFSFFSTGAQSWQVVGNEIVNPLLSVKARVWVDWNAVRQINSVVGVQDVTLTLYLVASNEQNIIDNPTYITVGGTGVNDVPWFYQANGLHPTLNGNNIKVLARTRKRIRPDLPQAALPATTVSGTSTQTMRLKYRWKRKLTYEDIPQEFPGAGGLTRSSVLRGWNYFLLLGTNVPQRHNASLLGTAVNVNIDRFVYFKDP